MGFVGLLKFSIKHIVLLAWPLCALGYPLCASVRAVETKSEAETQNLISYWISFSAILLFEHAFEKLLEWLAFWCYVKLVIIVGLVINDFSGSLYVYNHLFQPCLSLNLQTLIDWFNTAKKSFSKNDTFLVELDKYVNANGTDALQNLLAAKGVNLSHASKEVRAVTFEQGKVSAGPSVDMLHSKVLQNLSRIAESGLSLSKFEGRKAAGKVIDAVQMTENKQATSTMLVSSQNCLVLAQNDSTQMLLVSLDDDVQEQVVLDSGIIIIPSAQVVVPNVVAGENVDSDAEMPALLSDDEGLVSSENCLVLAKNDSTQMLLVSLDNDVQEQVVLDSGIIMIPSAQVVVPNVVAGENVDSDAEMPALLSDDEGLVLRDSNGLHLVPVDVWQVSSENCLVLAQNDSTQMLLVSLDDHVQEQVVLDSGIIMIPSAQVVVPNVVAGENVDSDAEMPALLSDDEGLAVGNELMAVDNNVKSLSVDQKQVLSAEPLEIEEIESSPVPVDPLEVENSSKSSNSVTSPGSLQTDEEETNFESEGIFVVGNGKSWHCIICKVYRSKKRSIRDHLSGKEHERIVKELQGKGVELRDSLWWCTVCDKSCGRWSNIGDHLNGKRHLAKLQ